MQNSKSVIITGATGGIGRSIVLKFARMQFDITLADQCQDELEALAAEISSGFGTRSIICSGDLGDMSIIHKLIGDSLVAWGKIDALVNSAAWRTIETMRTMDIATWDQTLKVCLTAPAFLSKLAAAAMEKQSNPGVIINISSVMADRAAGYSPAYTCAKGALDSLTRELAVTYGRSGIRVLSVTPGFIDTKMSRDYTNEKDNNNSNVIGENMIGSIPLARAGEPSEVAEAVFWLASGEASYITGTNLVIDGGFKHNFNEYNIKKLQFPIEF